METPQLEIFEDINTPCTKIIQLKPGTNLNLGDIIAVDKKAYSIVSGSFGDSGERYMALPIDADEAQGTINTLIQKGLRRKIKLVISIENIIQ